MTYSVKEDHWLGHVKRMGHHAYLDRYLREVQVVCVQTGEALSTATCYDGIMGSLWRKQKRQLRTDQNGVGVWPNASTWMRVESRPRVSYLSITRSFSLWLGLGVGFGLGSAYRGPESVGKAVVFSGW